MLDSPNSIQSVELILLALMVAVACVSGVARRFGVSYPIVLVLAGLAVSFVPGIPRIPLPPDIVFWVFLPPLLSAAAWQTSWREFRRNIISISMLAFGLVIFTAIGIAMTAHLFLPDFDWRLGFLLGAVVSPTDAVAASSIAKKVGMPQRIVDLLEGESLINDATGLLLLEFGLDMIVHGTQPTLLAGSVRFIWLIAGGCGIGLLLGGVVCWIERWIDDGPVEIVISIIVPYVAYIAGEKAHASGVIAVVACGLLMSQQSSSFFSPQSRLQSLAVWDALEFLLNGLIFILIGLQLPYVVSGLHDFTQMQLIGYGASFAILIIALRLVWMYPGEWITHHLRRVFQKDQEKMPDARHIFVTGWTGMRGVIALAAAISIPYDLSNGQPFRQRNFIVFLTFCVILVTLVLQGLTLPSLITALGMSEVKGKGNLLEKKARSLILRAAMKSLQRGRDNNPKYEQAYQRLLRQYAHRLDDIGKSGGEADELDADSRSVAELSLEAAKVEREELTRLRDRGRISDPLYRTLERELDLIESRLTSE
ncbi:Na+/H+ antiporter [soil metagenome]